MMKMDIFYTLTDAQSSGFSSFKMKPNDEWSVRVVFSKVTSELLSVTPLENLSKKFSDESVRNDEIMKMIGTDWSETDDHLTFTARMMVKKGVLFAPRNHPDAKKITYTVMCIPMSVASIEHTYLSVWRISSAYLKCPLGTVAGSQWKNGVGVAHVDVKTQSVLGLEFYDQSEESMMGREFQEQTPASFVEGEILSEKNGVIYVTCIMANGGVCFGGAIR